MELRKDKLVSVIIPFYNRLDLLLSSVKSVAEQTYRPIELILIDDNSTELFDRKMLDGFVSGDMW